MKVTKLVLSLLILLTCYSISAQKNHLGNFFQIVKHRNEEFNQRFVQKKSLNEEQLKKLEKDYKKYLRWVAFWEKRIDSDGDMSTYSQNTLNRANISAVKAEFQQKNMNVSWSQVGPATFPTGHDSYPGYTWPTGIKGIGRVDAIAVNPNNSNHVFIGTRAGGIWETLNINAANVVWNSLTNDIPSLTVNDLKIVNNTLYASTSSVGTVCCDNLYGLGVIRKNLNSSEWIFPKEEFDSYRMAISSSNPKIIYSVSNKKVHRSTDGGITWEVLTTPVANINNTKLHLEFIEVNPINSNVVIVAGRLSRWDSVSDPTTNLLVFRTEDGGRSWTNVTDTIESVINTAFSNAGSFDIPVDFSSIGNIPDAFATYDYNGTLYLGLRDRFRRVYFVTADGVWDNFTFYNTLGSNNRFSYGVDDMTMVFQVVDDDNILVGNRTFRRIKNSTHQIFSLGNYSQLHQDIRSIHYDASMGRLLMGTDGSIHKSFDSNNDLNFNNFPNLSGNLNLYLAYNMGYVNQGGTRTIRIGTQDTGWYENSNFGSDWNGWARTEGIWGEGMVFSDPNDGNIVYFSNKRVMQKSIDAGTSVGGTLFVIGSWSVGGGEPFQVSPNSSNQLVFDKLTTGGNYPIHLSNDQLSSHVNISNGVQDLVEGRNSALEISKANSSPLYIARHKFFEGFNNTIYKTANLDFSNPSNITYQNLTGNLRAYDPDILDKALVTDIEVDDTNANKVWIGFGNLEEGKKVYYSSDGGTTWTNISSNLPNIPLNTIQYDAVNQTLYTGTDYGVYYYNNSTGLWARYGVGLPVAIVTTIAIDNIANEIIASTHGRSVWTAPLMTAPCSDRIVTSSEVWLNDIDICGDLIIQGKGSLKSHARIKANNIIIKGGCSLTSEGGEITSNHHNTSSENLNTDIFVESGSNIKLVSATVNSFNINIADGANIFIKLQRDGVVEANYLNHSRINILDNATYSHATNADLILNDLESTVNLFDEFNLGAFGYATKIEAIPFGGQGSLNVIKTRDIYIQNETLIRGNKYRFDSDMSITTGNDVDINPSTFTGNFETNNADVILKAKQSITLDAGTIIEANSFIAFIDGDDLTNFNKNVIADKEDPSQEYFEVKEITEKIVESVSVYPNPASSFLHIKLNDETLKKGEVIIRDVSGNILKKILLENDEYKLDLSDFKKGVYFLNFSKGSTILFKRIIKL